MRKAANHIAMLLPIFICLYPFRSLAYTSEDLPTYGFALLAIAPYFIFYILWLKSHSIEPYFPAAILSIMAITTFIFYSPHEGFLLFFLIAIQSGVFCLSLPIYIWLKTKQGAYAVHT
jgi:hypothetical protein